MSPDRGAGNEFGSSTDVTEDLETTPVTEPALVEVGTRADLPLYSWGPDWWSLLEEFAGVADQDPQRSQFDAFPDTAIGRPPQLLYPVETLPADIQEGLRALATAIHTQDTPAAGIGLLCGMTSLLGKRTGALFAALPPLMREVGGDERVAVNIPLKLTGEPDGRFPLHADLFPAGSYSTSSNVPTPWRAKHY